MILTPHAIVGASLANMFPNDPVLGFGLAFASHYLLDMIPHAEYDIHNFIDRQNKTTRTIFHTIKSFIKMPPIILIDFFVGVSLCSLIFIRDEKTLYLTMIGIFASVLPDFLQFIYLQYKNRFWIKVQKIHDYFHGENQLRSNLILSNLTEIIIPIIFVTLFYLLKI
jgi:hypothetical protein